MAVTNSVRVQTDGHRYHEFESGVGVWVATVQHTGDATAGETQAQFLFNADSNSRFQNFIAVTRIAVAVDAALNEKAAWAFMPQGQWERQEDASGGDVSVATFDLTKWGATASNHYAGNWYGFVNLGRVVEGRTGNFEVRVENINSGSYTIYAEGLTAEHALAARWWAGA
jgi:hypothetical protein